MCDSNNINLYSDEEMYLDGFKYDEIVGMLGPGLDNNFLDSVMGELEKDENLMDSGLEFNTSQQISSFENQFVDDDQENKMYFGTDKNSFNNRTINSSSVLGSDPLLMQSILSDTTNNFIKTEPIQNTSIIPITTQVNESKPIVTSTPIQQPILTTSTNYCNIKPAPSKNTIPIAKNGTQFQNVKPISIQNNISGLPKIVQVQSLSKDKQIFVHSPTVMYAATKVQPVTTVTTGTNSQTINTFPNTNTLVFLDTSDSKVPVHRVSVKHGRVGKRLAHNATEKKYRLSISSGIESLKNLVVGEDAKLQKSAILRKAVDFILSLQKQNRDLRRQNAELVKASKIGNVKDLLAPTNEYIKVEQFIERESYGAMTPPRSDISNPSSSPSYNSDNSMPSSPYSIRDDSDSEIVSNPRGMAPHERLTLCCFMLALVAFNPFGSFMTTFLNNPEPIPTGTGRGILSADYDYDPSLPWENIGISAIVWIFNFIILSICLIKMLAYGDPLLAANSKSTDDFWRHKRHAEVEFSKGNGPAAYRELNRCLQSYGLFLPTTKKECFTATSWQFIRMILHRLWIGKFLSRKAGGLFCSSEKRIQALTSAKELSLVYLRLNQINLSSNMQDSNGLLMSLYAMNMADAASSDVMSSKQLAEIYLTAALRVKRSYPKIIQFLSRQYLNRTKQEITKLCSDIPPEFQWLLTPYGYKFFVNNSFEYNINSLSDTPLFSNLGNKADPMSYVMKKYREHLLEKALQCLIGNGQGNNKKNVPDHNSCRINKVLHYTQMLMDTLVKDSSDRDTACKDRLTHWWATVLSIATYWILGDKETAERLESQIEKLPLELYESTDCLPKAFFVTFKAKRAIMNKSGVVIENVYNLCNTGTELLAESLKCNKCKNVKGMKLLSQFLACNWLLETRTALWEMEYNVNKKTGEYICAKSEVMSTFQKDLNSLRMITENIVNAESRVFLYEAIYRLMAGAAPGPTHELLNRNMTYRHTKSSIICGKDRNHDWDGGEREKADAIFIANKYLPTNLFSDARVRRGLLMEAINILEKIGDKNKLDDCNQLLSSIGSSAAN